MKKVIYRIYSESVKVGNYIDYDPSRSFRNNANLREYLISKYGKKLGDKSNREKDQFFFEKSKCVKYGSKNEESFTTSPKNCKVVKIVLPKGKKNVTIGFPIRDGETEENIEISVEPSLWTEKGTVVGNRLIAKDSGISRIKGLQKLPFTSYYDMDYIDQIRLISDGYQISEDDVKMQKGYRFVPTSQTQSKTEKHEFVK